MTFKTRRNAGSDLYWLLDLLKGAMRAATQPDQVLRTGDRYHLDRLVARCRTALLEKQDELICERDALRSRKGADAAETVEAINAVLEFQDRQALAGHVHRAMTMIQRR